VILSKKQILFLYKKNKTNLSRNLRIFYPETFNFIKKTIKKQNSNNFSEKIYRFLYPDKGTCVVCGRDTTFRTLTIGFLKHCSQSCQQLNTAKKYGVKNLFQSEKIKKKIRKTWMKKYGVDCPTKNKDIIKKGKLSKLEKYGNENFSNPKKVIQTCLEKYGVSNPNKLNSIRKKIEKTNLQRYGVKYFNNSEKTKQTNIKKYGVEYPSQNIDIHLKQLKNAYRIKQYTTRTNKIIHYQGYENFALDILLNEYQENDIITDKKQIPHFSYKYNNKIKKYFPDIFIKSENIVIEVKSVWTDILHKEIDKLKEECVIENGFKFRKYVFNKKGEIVKLYEKEKDIINK
jgi:hypothetical protein